MKLGPFPNSKDSHFQNEAKYKTFLVNCTTIKFIFIFSLALKQRLLAIQKWSIEINVYVPHTQIKHNKAQNIFSTLKYLFSSSKEFEGISRKLNQD